MKLKGLLSQLIAAVIVSGLFIIFAYGLSYVGMRLNNELLENLSLYLGLASGLVCAISLGFLLVLALLRMLK